MLKLSAWAVVTWAPPGAVYHATSRRSSFGFSESRLIASASRLIIVRSCTLKWFGLSEMPLERAESTSLKTCQVAAIKMGTPSGQFGLLERVAGELEKGMLRRGLTGVGERARRGQANMETCSKCRGPPARKSACRI
eukprot:4856839-Pyramimonas_sp.AAC.2